MSPVALGLPRLQTHAVGNAPTFEWEGMPTRGPLMDRFGRAATDVRISVTDKCNLRCTYCMPAEGLEWLPNDQLLRVEEIARLLRIAVTRLQVREIRFTGGEPLLRKEIYEIVRAATSLTPRPEVSLTTNGLGLRHGASRLAESGVDRLNISLDAADRHTYAQSTRRDRFEDVVAGMAAASAAGMRPIKVNAVLSAAPDTFSSALVSPSSSTATDKSWNLIACELLEFCLSQGFELRFIEQMPLDAGRAWRREKMITADHILEALSARYFLSPVLEPQGSAPARRWLVNGGPATVGVIASVTQPFCGACDRTRITADGFIRNCLFAAEETDIREVLRSPQLDDSERDVQIETLWRRAMWTKRAGHGMDDPLFQQPDRPMSAIGG